MSTFRGWPEGCQRFFIGLELDNSKKYFEANRRTYEESVRGPMAALLDSLKPDYGDGKIFRANRDIRFSKDKSPYKTNIAATVGMGEKGGYISLDARSFTVATGRYMLSPEELTKFRKKVASESAGALLAAIVKKLERSGYDIGGEELKRVPADQPASRAGDQRRSHRGTIQGAQVPEGLARSGASDGNTRRCAKSR